MKTYYDKATKASVAGTYFISCETVVAANVRPIALLVGRSGEFNHVTIRVKSKAYFYRDK